MDFLGELIGSRTAYAANTLSQIVETDRNWDADIQKDICNIVPYMNEKYPDYDVEAISSKYELNHQADVIGSDNGGGASYGKYQIATKLGTMSDFIRYLGRNGYGEYQKGLIDAGGAKAALRKDRSFVEKWKSFSNDDIFSDAQKEFLIANNLCPALRKVQNIEGLNLKDRSGEILKSMFSTAVQHGGTGAANLMRKAWGTDVSKLTDEDLIRKLYDARSNPRNFTKIRDQYKGISKRMSEEEKDILNLLNNN